MAGKKRVPGERWQTPEADEINKWNETSETEQRERRLGEVIPDQRIPVHTELDKVQLRNDSGQDLPAGAVLEVDGTHVGADQQGQRQQNGPKPSRVHPWYKGKKPSDDPCARYAVLVRALPKGRQDDAQISGPTFARVDITNSKTRCRKADGQFHFVGDDNGPIPIIWVPEGANAGVQLCKVDMQQDGVTPCYKAVSEECAEPGDGYRAKIYEFNCKSGKFDKLVTDPAVLGVAGPVVDVLDPHQQAWMAKDITGDGNDVCRVVCTNGAGECEVRWINTSEHKLQRWVVANQDIAPFSSGSVSPLTYNSCDGQPYPCSVTACNGEHGEIGVRLVKKGEKLLCSFNPSFASEGGQRQAKYKLMYRNVGGEGSSATMCATMDSDRTREQGAAGPFGQAAVIPREVIPSNIPGGNVVKFCDSHGLGCVKGCSVVADLYIEETQQGEQQTWVVKEAQTLEPKILCELQEDRPGTGQADVTATILKGLGSGSANYPAEAWAATQQSFKVRFCAGQYPDAKEGAQVWCVLDVDVENGQDNLTIRYHVDVSDQVAQRIRFDYDGICPGETVTVDRGDVTAMTPWPFSQIPKGDEKGKLSIPNRHGHAQDGPGEMHAVWDTSRGEYVLDKVEKQSREVRLPGCQKQEQSIESCKKPEDVELEKLHKDLRWKITGGCSASGPPIAKLFGTPIEVEKCKSCDPADLPAELQDACLSSQCGPGQSIYYNPDDPTEFGCYDDGSEPEGWLPCPDFQDEEGLCEEEVLSEHEFPSVSVVIDVYDDDCLKQLTQQVYVICGGSTLEEPVAECTDCPPTVGSENVGDANVG